MTLRNPTRRQVLDAWALHEKGLAVSSSASEQPLPEPASRTGVGSQTMTLLSRHFKLTIRDPAYYTARMGIFHMTCCFFALIYLDSRDRTQEQARPTPRLSKEIGRGRGHSAHT